MSSKIISYSILLVLGFQWTSAGADSASKEFKPVTWSVEYSPDTSTTVTPSSRPQDHDSVSYSEPEISPRLASLQDTFFDAQRELSSRSMNENQWVATSSNPMTDSQVASQPTKPSLAYQIPAANTNWSAQTVPFDGPVSGESFPYSTIQPTGTSTHYEPNLHLSSPHHKPNMLIASAGSSSTGHSYITRDAVARHLTGAPLWHSLSQELMQRASAIKGEHLLPLEQLQLQPQIPLLRNIQQSGRQNANPKTTWLKNFGAKRRSYDPSSESPIAQRLTGVNFDDTVEAIRVKEPDQTSSHSRNHKDYLMSYSTMPLVYDLPPPSLERKNMKLSLNDDEHLGSVDHLFSSSKSMGHTMPTFYQAYPAYTATAHVAPRKGLEKALGVPILVGIGAALISFLIISNLFLSVPLFAMTLLQLINGGSNLMPNNNGNNMPPNNNMNNGQNGNGQTTNGRKRRDLSQNESDIERRFKKAIDVFS